MKVGLDTNIFSFLIKPNNKIAEKIFYKIQSVERCELMVSTIVLAEIYSAGHFTKEYYDLFMETLENMGNVTIIKYDENSAVENGTMVALHGLNAQNRPRQAIKSDYLIVSNCIANECDIFLTEDKDLIKHLKDNPSIRLINPNDLPSPPKDLLGDPM